MKYQGEQSEPYLKQSENVILFNFKNTKNIYDIGINLCKYINSN